jgi:hypothetical protein
MRTWLLPMLLLATPSSASEPTSPATTGAPEFGPMAFLAGFCWEAPMPDPKLADSQCYKWFQRGRYLRMRHEMKGSSPPYGGETTYWWDHDARKLRYIFWSNPGTHAQGEVRFEADVVRFENERLVGAGFERFHRATLRRIDAEAYSYRLERREDGGAWREIQNATYRRKPLNW